MLERISGPIRRFRFNRPTWAEILTILYTEEVALDQHGGQDIAPEVTFDLLPVIQRNGEFETAAILDALRFLRGSGLIAVNIQEAPEEMGDNDIMAMGGLTQAGFRVAHQRQLEKRQHYTNLLLVVLTVILVVLTVLLAAPIAIGWI